MKRSTYRSIREYLDATDTTQEVLAERLGISQAHLSLIINGQRNPSISLAIAIETATGVSPRDQVAGEA